MDPYKNTRREFVADQQSIQFPEGADPKWLDLATKLKKLAWLLAYHEAMEPNIDQIYMTPAASKNKVYFTWDFVSRTFGNLIQVPPSLRGMSKEQRETWSDCVDRSTMSKNLILDTQPGMLDMMTEASYPNQGGEPPVFGAEILAVAREL